MTLRTLFRSAVILLTLAGAERATPADIPCEAETTCVLSWGTELGPYCITSKFWLEAESRSGARGDVVGVTFTLHAVPDFEFTLHGINLAVCHDPSVAELVGEPVYSEEILDERDTPVIFFLPVQEDQNPDTHSGYGFLADFLMMPAPFSGEMPIMTAYYRLIGAPGEVSEIAFCEGSLVRHLRHCNFNGIRNDWIGSRPRFPILSTQNRDGTLRVHDGPVTRPDRPPEPPEALVYPEPPTSDEVNLRVRIGNAVAVAGEREVPVEVFVTADVEYTAVIVPIDFDERYLQAARVEDNFLSGTALIDNEDSAAGPQAEEGYVVIASYLGGSRRIAAAGEEFHAATIYFDVLESATGITETTLESRPVGGRVSDPFVVVRHLLGASAEQVEVRSEIGAVLVAHGRMAIRASVETIPGDANLDHTFDISDPVSVLGHLFLGQSEPLCPPAADYDGDGRLVITDPIRMLGVLFQGQPPPATAASGTVECR